MALSGIQYRVYVIVAYATITLLVFSLIVGISATPHRIPLAVVAPAPASSQVVTKLNLIPSAPLHATAASSLAAARRLIGDEAVSATLVINPAAKTDTLLIASADGSSVASAAEQVITAAEASQHRSVAVTDIVPLQRGDYHGLAGFYLVVGWAVGGYLVAALLQLRDPLPILSRRAGPLPGIDLGLFHPVTERLGVDAEPMADPGDRTTPVPCLRTQLEDHLHCPFPQLSGMRFLDTMSPNLPRGHSLRETRGSPSPRRHWDGVGSGSGGEDARCNAPRSPLPGDTDRRIRCS